MKINKKAVEITFFLLIFILTFHARVYAVKNTSITFSPDKVSTLLGEPVTLNIFINPGSNYVSMMELGIVYDHKLATFSATSQCGQSFCITPGTHGGNARYYNGRIVVELSDTNRFITSPRQLGTITFKPLHRTDSQGTFVAFDEETYALSIASQDTAVENVIQSTNSANILVRSPGDFNEDYSVDILDYNMIRDCYGIKINSSTCRYKERVDFDKNGSIDGIDYNSFIRSIES